MVSGAMGRFERPRSAAKGRREDDGTVPRGVAGIAKKAILRCSAKEAKLMPYLRMRIWEL